MKAEIIYTKKSIYRRFIENKHLHYYIFFGIVVIIAMSFSAYNCSPFVEYIGVDSGMYLVMGRSMSEGGKLYIDLFDHKGPLIFVVNAIPQMFIHSTLGVWILEIIFMLLTCIVLYKCGEKLLQNNFALLPPIVYILGVCCLFNGGNYTEEYCNLFAVLAIYIFISWENDNYKALTNKNAFLLGLYFAAAFFFRPNNVVVIAVVIAYIGIYSILKDRKVILGYVAFFLLGVSLISGIIILYHLYKGSLYDMLYATIIHNFNYCKSGYSNPLLNGGSSNTIFRNYLCLLSTPVVYAIIRCLIYKDKTNTIFLSALYVMCLLSVFLSGRRFSYYLVLMIPVVCVAVILIIYHATKDLKKLLKKRIIPITVACSLLSLIILFSIADMSRKIEVTDKYTRLARELVSNIPLDERNEVFGYDIPSRWFYRTDITPCYKYFTMQSWMSQTTPQIDIDVITFVENEPPKWIIINEAVGVGNTELIEVIHSNYELIGKNGTGSLYRLVE